MEREKVISNYISAYNNFDIEKMLTDLDENIQFENISNDVTNMTLKDLTAFRNQAEQAKNIFSKRRQTITSWKHLPNQTEIEIAYFAVLAIDLPNGLKKGESLNLSGKTIFTFLADKIIEIKDYS